MKRHLRLVGQRIELSISLGKPSASLVIHAVAVLPVFTRNEQRSAGGDDVVYQLLRHGDVGCLGNEGFGPSTRWRYSLPAAAITASTSGRHDPKSQRAPAHCDD